MKQLSLNNLGVQELDAREMGEVDGGGIVIGFLLLFSGAVLTDMLMNPSSALDALEEGYNSTNRY
ncbi:MAG: hypothetical protein RBR30_02765 [Tenuifilaceae bacterium]|nr:hypothetical protein [Tenuifilaceae bacterium]